MKTEDEIVEEIIAKYSDDEEDCSQEIISALYQYDRQKALESDIYRGKRGGIGGPASDDVSLELVKMIGATIKDAGFVKGIDEGGLAFEYEKNGKMFRIVIGYNELGEWIEYSGEKK